MVEATAAGSGQMYGPPGSLTLPPRSSPLRQTRVYELQRTWLADLLGSFGLRLWEGFEVCAVTARLGLVATSQDHWQLLSPGCLASRPRSYSSVIRQPRASTKALLQTFNLDSARGSAENLRWEKPLVGI